MTVELIPALKLTPEEEAQIKEYVAKVDSLVALAGIDITDQASLSKSGEAKLSLESYHKAVKNYFADIIDPLEEELKRWKLQRGNLMGTTEPAYKALVERQRTWMAAEKARTEAQRKRAQEEADRENQRKIDEDRRQAIADAARAKADRIARINEDFKAGMFGKREFARLLREAGAEEEAAKATADAVADEEKAKPAPTVRVAPAIPKVAGVRNQTFYYASIEDKGAAILAELVSTKDVNRRAFLMQFVLVSSTEVSAHARNTKNNEQTMKDLPGVKAWSNG
jgi:hypothetical protein